MRRITLVLTGIAIVAAMLALSALAGSAQVLDAGDDQYEDGGALDTGGDDQYEDDGALDTGDEQYEDDGALDTGGDEGDVDPDDQVDPDPDPVCAPGWYREWYQWYTPDWAWWYFWWFQWCYTEDDGWYRDYDSWEWWGPIG